MRSNTNIWVELYFYQTKEDQSSLSQHSYSSVLNKHGFRVLKFTPLMAVFNSSSYSIDHKFSGMNHELCVFLDCFLSQITWRFVSQASDFGICSENFSLSMTHITDFMDFTCDLFQFQTNLQDFDQIKGYKELELAFCITIVDILIE